MLPTSTREFSEATLEALLRALRERTSTHPENPGLIASWPHVREDRMAAACTLLINRGHPLFKVRIPTAKPGATREGWALRAATDQPLVWNPHGEHDGVENDEEESRRRTGDT
jgi:hypothetical protein